MTSLPQLEGLQILEDNRQPEDAKRTQRGDTIRVHYTGVLSSGQQFDSSRPRGKPLEFTVGEGQVIKGWDEGLLNMAVGEKRKLTIAPHLGYGARGAPGAIPPNSTLVFDTELIEIVGQ